MCVCVSKLLLDSIPSYKLVTHMESAPVRTSIPQKTTLPIFPCISIHPTLTQGVEEFRAAAAEATLIFISAKLRVVCFSFFCTSA